MRIKDDDYIMVQFPDVPEAITQGETIEGAYEKAVEVLGFALEDYENYPDPSSFKEVSEEFPNEVINLIGVDMLDYYKKYKNKSVRKNVTIPEWIEELAVKENINSSQTLTDALVEKLGV